MDLRTEHLELEAKRGKQKMGKWKSGKSYKNELRHLFQCDVICRYVKRQHLGVSTLSRNNINWPQHITNSSSITSAEITSDASKRIE